MLASYGALNAFRTRHIRAIIISIIWGLMIGLGIYTNAMSSMKENETIYLSKQEVPLLLNSGLAESEKADVSIILWFENSEIPFNILTSKPTLDWVWSYKELQIPNEKGSFTLTGQHLIDKNEEQILFAWYTTMAPQIESAGGRIYLDERVPQTIDISAYLSQINAIPTQYILSDNIMSTAAYQDTIETSVMAGQDKINIQLLSRGRNIEGQSVLAIPVLLKQF
ncbi:MAG TPA: hypothetical protein DEF42_08785 [Desulfosporosinus sp.]|nr:hypothetical protein [Desulfosporosinus sp.]